LNTFEQDHEKGTIMKKYLVALALLLGIVESALAQWQVPDHAVPIGRGPGFTGFKNAPPGAAGLPFVSNGASSDPGFGPQNIVATGSWFSQNGMITHRFNDNVLIGGATANDMAFPNVTKDWLSTFQTAAGLPAGSILTAELGVLTQNSAASADGATGIVTGAQSQFSTSAGTSTIALSGYAVNNNTTLATNAWAWYGECHKTNAATNQCIGMEMNPRSTIATVTPTPFQQGDVIATQLACGAGLASTQDCSTGIAVEANPNKFRKGIVFGDTSLTAGGTGGNGTAIDFSRNQSIRWANSAPGTDVEAWGNASGLNLSVPLIVASGGTGAATHTSSGILYGNGTGAIGSGRCTMDSNQSITCASASAFLPQFTFRNSTSDAQSAFFLFDKNRSGGNTNASDLLGQLTYRGFANAAQQNSASVRAVQNGASSGNNIPSRIEVVTSNTAGQLNQSWTFNEKGHMAVTASAAPTLTAGCNGAGNAITGNNAHGTATGQTAAATTCTLTFANSGFMATPDCNVTGLSSPLTGAITPTTTTLVVNFASTANYKFTWHCFGL
jgi:hypothetical protein